MAPLLSSGGAADVLLARLEHVIQRGLGRWSARCPAHDDRSPSLSVTETDEGRVLFHDFAGCAPEAILSALGLTWRDLYADPWTAAQAAQHAHRVKLSAPDPLEVDRWVLRIAAAHLRAGKVLSVEDRARVEVARLRLAAAGREAA